MDEAVYDMIQGLSAPEKTCCAGFLGSRIRNYVQSAHVKFVFDATETDCASVNPFSDTEDPHVIHIGPTALQPGHCLPCLASTILHEVSHLLGTTDLHVSLPFFSSAYDLEKKCGVYVCH
jgi:hypothetical protein